MRQSRMSGWMPIGAQIADAVLRRLGLQLAGGADERHQRQVDVERVLAADVLAQLADRFEERQALDVADRAADLDEHDVDVARDGADAVLDLVGDVRNDLHGAPEIVAAAFLLDDRQVDLAGGPVVVAGRDLVGEALVVPEVEVGLGAVVGDVDLAVLVRAHRAGIDVDVGVELLQGDLVAVPFEQRADGGGGEPLAERGHDAAGDEDVLDGPGGAGFRVHDVAHVSLCAPIVNAFGALPRARSRAVPAGYGRESRSSGVSTPIESYVVSMTLMRMPCSSARSCSSASDCSSAVGGETRQPQQALAPIDIEPDVPPRRRGRAVLRVHTESARARNTARSRRDRRRPW